MKTMTALFVFRCCFCYRLLYCAFVLALEMARVLLSQHVNQQVINYIYIFLVLNHVQLPWTL